MGEIVKDKFFDLKVSIITVSYNSEKTIEQTINSVLGQTYGNIEYIVVDGLSTDGTYEKISKYKDKIDVIIHESDDGIYDAMNKGLKKATGDYIGILNSDDWYERDTVEYIVNHFEDCYDVLYARMNIINEDDELVRVTERQYIEDIWYSMISHPTVFVRREIYEKFGTFDTSYKIVADYDLILRFYVYGARFRFVDYAVTNFRLGGLSTTNNLKVASEVYKVSMKYIDKCTDKEKYLHKIINCYRGAKLNELFNCNNERFVGCFEKTIINKEKLLVIYGAGKNGYRFARRLSECNIRCDYFVDKDEDKHGLLLNGIVIISLSELPKLDCNIVISVLDGCESIYKYLSGILPNNIQIALLYDFVDENE
jgi:glycosyltransferase involved in cell wall biosynthesis